MKGWFELLCKTKSYWVKESRDWLYHLSYYSFANCVLVDQHQRNMSLSNTFQDWRFFIQSRQNQKELILNSCVSSTNTDGWYTDSRQNKNKKHEIIEICNPNFILPYAGSEALPSFAVGAFSKLKNILKNGFCVWFLVFSVVVLVIHLSI